MGLRVLLLGAALATAAPEAGEARVSLDVRDADVQDLARLFADLAPFQLVMDPGVSCRITLKMHAVRWDTAFRAVLRSCGLAHEEQEGVLRVATAARLADEARAERMLLDAQREARPRSVMSLRLSYARAAEMAPLVRKLLSPQGDVIYDVRTNTLIVVD